MNETDNTLKDDRPGYTGGRNSDSHLHIAIFHSTWKMVENGHLLGFKGVKTRG